VGISGRDLFLRSVLVGLIAGLPAWAIAKGQWCNGKVVRHKVSLTAQSVTVAGAAVTAPAGALYDLTTSAVDAKVVSGQLHCPNCTGQIISRDNLTRQP
jgi:hypothetical protein